MWLNNPFSFYFVNSLKKRNLPDNALSKAFPFKIIQQASFFISTADADFPILMHDLLVPLALYFSPFHTC